MSDEQTAQDATVEEPTQSQEPSATSDKTDAELRRARDDAAKYRTRLREAEAQLAELQPKAAKFDEFQESQKTEQQKLAEQLEATKAELERARQEQALSVRRANLLKLATRSGVDPDLVDLLDINKIPLDDEAEATKMLQRFAATRPSGGAASNPGRGSDNGADDEWKTRIFGQRSSPTIFGG